jgi:hypothetical protein
MSATNKDDFSKEESKFMYSMLHKSFHESERMLKTMSLTNEEREITEGRKEMAFALMNKVR